MSWSVERVTQIHNLTVAANRLDHIEVHVMHLGEASESTV